MKVKQILIFLFLLLINCFFIFGLKELPELTLALGDGGSSTDVLLLTQINQYLNEEGYENMPQGITKLFSQIESLDERVTLVVYEGEVEIIVGEESPDDYYDFAEDLADILDEKDIVNKITHSERLETENLLELYDIKIEEQPVEEETQIIEEQPVNRGVEEETDEIPLQEKPEQPPVKEEPPRKNIFYRFLDWLNSLF